MKHRGLVFFLLTLAALVFGQEGGAPGKETVALEAPVFCEGSVAVIRAEILALWDSTELDVFINCLAFNGDRRLENGIVSAMPRDGAPGTRYMLSCRNNALVAMQSNQPAIRFNLTEQAYTACVNCRDLETANDICNESQTCSPECEKCAVNQTNCTECNGYRLLLRYTAGRRPTADEIERDRERLERNGREEDCNDNPDTTSFSCVPKCPDNGNHSAPSEKDHICYACGLEYCVECEQGEETGGRSECTACLVNTTLFDGECYSCSLACIARTAIVQEAEEQAEQASQLVRQIELAVTLPVVSLSVIMVFILLSVYAHYRYPHVSHKGHKRHRTKPDVFTVEQTTSTSTIPSRVGGEPEPLQESHVWRAQPSIRFR